jgi:hypothetical protein
MSYLMQILAGPRAFLHAYLVAVVWIVAAVAVPIGHRVTR